MKKVIRWILNRVPRRHIQRVVPVIVPLLEALYVGRKIECPVCRGHFRTFLPYGYGSAVRENALCPRCLALERHRLMWLYLQRETNLFTARLRLLHLAPERCFIKRFEKLLGENYVTGDIESPLARVKLDIQQMPFTDESFDVIFCNHVLEHVEDDRQALREMHRVLRRGGWGMLLAPVNYNRAETFENPSITDQAGRLAAFGQPDHVREYGRDYPDRLAEAGFDVLAIDYLRQLETETVTRHALRPEILYVVRKDGTGKR